MPTAKTSVSDPLRIAVVTPDGTQGRIGITLCPGKTDSSAWSGPWARDLDLDLDVIQHWGATALLSLIEDQEFDRLSVRGLGNAVEHRHMEWWHLPIVRRQINPDQWVCFVRETSCRVTVLRGVHRFSRLRCASVLRLTCSRRARIAGRRPA